MEYQTSFHRGWKSDILQDYTEISPHHCRKCSENPHHGRDILRVHPVAEVTHGQLTVCNGDAIRRDFLLICIQDLRGRAKVLP